MGLLMLAVATYIRAIFVRRHKLALEAAALRHNSPFSKGSNLGQGSAARTDSSGLRYGDCIRIGLMRSSWSDRKRWCPGIALASVCSGGGSSNSGSTCPNQRFLATCKV